MRGAVNQSLKALVYRSRAVRSLSPVELHELTSVSNARNGREGITGLMLYDNEHFFQWLEGPPANVNRVMSSISNDSRHTDVQVLNAQSLPSRRFGGWNMKLATPGPVGDALRRDIIDPPPEIVQDLRKRPQAAPALLARLRPLSSPEDMPATETLANVELTRKTAAVLKDVFLAAILPQLADGIVASSGTPPQPAHPRAAELADLLVATDPTAAIELIREIHESGGTVGAISASLLEPAARRLGDLWSEDFCSEFDVTLGLCRLQSAVRVLSPGTLEARPRGKKLPVVLIAPEPGELHRLGAALDSTVLRDAGWAPHTEYPSDDNALDDLLSAKWFDVLDLSLSTAFRRDQSLPQLTKTIADARRASRNPALVVVVGGRVFLEEKEACASVGADQALTTAFNVNRSILQTLDASVTQTTTIGQSYLTTPTPS
jgi:methanogenic corrinoid protein MtbC1